MRSCKLDEDGERTYTLCINSEDYIGSGIHLHDVISDNDMYRYNVGSGRISAGDKVRIVGGWDWWRRWFPKAIKWNWEESCIAYNVSDYLVVKPK